MDQTPHALDGLRRELTQWSQRSGVRTVAGLFALIGGILPLPVLGMFGPAPAVFWGGGLAVAGCAWLLQLNRLRELRQWRKRLSQQLASSGLLERIAIEGLPQERAVDAIPLPFRWMFPQLASGKVRLASELRMVASNLDWYLRAPRPLVRGGWISLPFALLCVLLFTGMGLGMYTQPLPYSGLGFYLFLQNCLFSLMHLCQISYGLDHERETIARSVFAEELLKRLDAPPPQLTAAQRAEYGLPELPSAAAARTAQDASIAAGRRSGAA